MHRGGIRCSIQSVLWSPVGAPAGVPGPRRNADECDAGWFAPVATRRRSIFGAFQAPSPKARSLPRGTTPPEPPMGPWPRIASTYGPGSGRCPRGPRAASGPWNLLAPGTVPPDSPPAPPSRWGQENRATCGVQTTLSAAHTSVGAVFPGPTDAGICNRSQVSAGTGRGVGRRLPGREVLSAPSHPPRVAPTAAGKLGAAEPVRSGRWVSWARSSVRAQLTHRLPHPRPAPSHPASMQPTEGTIPASSRH